MLSLFRKQKTTPNFFSLPAREKKELIDKAAKGANKLQGDLLKEYDKVYGHDVRTA